MALYSDLVGLVSQAAYFARLMAQHVKNEVPVDTWLSEANTGLSTTQYVSELLAQLRALITGTFRAMFLEEWQGLLDGAADAAERESIEERITIVGRNLYGTEREQPQLQLARFTLVASDGAPTQTIDLGAVAGSLGSNGLLWAAEESGTLAPGQRLVVLFRASAAGADHNIPVGTPLELKSALVGVTIDNRASGPATAVGFGNSGLLMNAAQAGVTVELVLPGANQPLVTTGNLGTKRLTVQLETDGGGAAISTSEDVRQALATAVSALGVPQLLLSVKNAGTGAGVMAPTTSPIALDWDGSYIQEAGADRESALRYKRRCETRLDTIGGGGGGGIVAGSVGTEDALVYWGLQKPAGYKASPVRYVRVLSNNRLGAMSGGESTVILAGAAGAITAMDVAAVAENYESPKKYWGGLSVVSAVTATIYIYGTVHVRPAAGKTLDDISTSIAVALAKFLEIIGEEWSTNETPIIYPEKLAAVIDGADAVAISRVDLTFPPGPTTLAWNEFPAWDTTNLVIQYG